MHAKGKDLSSKAMENQHVSSAAGSVTGLLSSAQQKADRTLAAAKGEIVISQAAKEDGDGSQTTV